MSVVNVLTPHGRRQNVKVQPNTPIIKVRDSYFHCEIQSNQSENKIPRSNRFLKKFVTSINSIQMNMIYCITNEFLI